MLNGQTQNIFLLTACLAISFGKRIIDEGAWHVVIDTRLGVFLLGVDDSVRPEESDNDELIFLFILLMNELIIIAFFPTVRPPSLN